MPAKRKAGRSSSDESAVSLELSIHSDKAQASSHSLQQKVITLQAELYGQHWNFGQDLDEELEPASDMSYEGDVRNGYANDASINRDSFDISDSSARIEIRDLGSEGSSNFTTSTLRKCKKVVLRPYWNLLVFIGWRAFNKESVFAHGIRWRLWNALYTSAVVLLLLYSYSYEVLACEWKLDHKAAPVAMRTQLPKVKTTVDPREENISTTAIPAIPEVVWSHAQSDKRDIPLRNASILESALLHDENPACNHIVTTYLIPNILHFMAYVIGFYYFRVQENEQLDALMEKVFLQATTVQARTASQQRMIKTQRNFLIFGGVWVLMSGLLQCLYMWAFDFPKLPLFHNVHAGFGLILFALEVVGRTVFNSVILAIVVNFVTQCEMVKVYVKGLVMRLQEKSTDLKTAMKDVLMLRQSLSQLNGLISKMTTLAGVILAELTVIGVFLLLVNEYNSPKMWAYRSLFPLVWATMLSMPLYQAARVNSICLRIQKCSLEMRVFGYKGASLLDLDSFMQFVQNTKLRAKLFHINIIPSQIIFTCLVAAFVLLVLIQTSHIGPDHLFI